MNKNISESGYLLSTCNIDNNSQAIGFIDSGLGGLSILNKVWQKLPNENTIYIADSKYAPYGNKSLEFIQQRCLDLCNFLLQHKVKTIVIACNTATTNCIDYLRSNINSIPIIGVEPAIKPAFLGTMSSKNKKVGILATENTLNSNNFKKLVSNITNTLSEYILIQEPGNGLVECIEQQNISMDNQKLVTLCKMYIDKMLEHGIDTIVLGCTHYPFLLPILNTTYPNINFVESSLAIANHLYNTLENNSKLNLDFSNKITHYLYSSLCLQHIKEFVINKNINVNVNDNHNINYRILLL